MHVICATVYDGLVCCVRVASISNAPQSGAFFHYWLFFFILFAALFANSNDTYSHSAAACAAWAGHDHDDVNCQPTPNNNNIARDAYILDNQQYTNPKNAHQIDSLHTTVVTRKHTTICT